MATTLAVALTRLRRLFKSKRFLAPFFFQNFDEEFFIFAS